MTERPRSALERLQALEAERGRALAPAAMPGARRKRGVLASVWSALLLLVWKLKAALLLLGKVGATASTMALSMWLYSSLYGWPFAAGFVILILVHELGHGLAARLVGLPVGAPVFIPFFGAVIALKKRPRTTFEDFIIGAGGPLAGSAGGVLAIVAAGSFHGSLPGLLYAVGYFTLIINLFNLFPVWQLDGARMTAPLTPALWTAGTVVLALVLLHDASASGHVQPIPMLLVALCAWRSASAWWSGRSQQGALARLASAGKRQQDSDVTPDQRLIAAGVYFALAIALCQLAHSLHHGLPSVHTS